MRHLPRTVALVAMSVYGSFSCAHPPAPRQSGIATPADGQVPLILNANEGEQRVRRIGGVARFTIKIDPVTARSPHLVMVTEAVAPNEGIPAHVHPSEDEMIFVHSGTGTVELGNRHESVTAGATVYIPRATRIALRNTGSIPLEIVAVFSGVGFEEYLRDTSVPDGQPVFPLTSAELASIRQRHAEHVVWERR